MDAITVVRYLESEFGAFRTGSVEWGVASSMSDIDIVVSEDTFCPHSFKSMVCLNGWQSQKRGSNGVKFISNRADNPAIDIIIVPQNRIEIWRIATNVMSSIAFSSPKFKKAIESKRIRVGVFEGLRALLTLAGL